MTVSGQKNKRYYHHRLYQQILKDWYGPERGRSEMLAYCPEVIGVDGLVDDILGKVISEDQLNIFKLRDNWETIAGIQLAKVCNPVAMNDGIIEVEVTHPAWTRELQGPLISKRLIENINNLFGENFCTGFRFVAAGRN